jgi:hypothetical protein
MADEPAPLPDPVNIPPELIADWMALAADQPIEARLHRQDLDNFYSAIDKSLHATDRLRQGVVHFVNGSTEDGNASLEQCTRLLIESQNRLRQFMLAIMYSATRQK